MLKSLIPAGVITLLSLMAQSAIAQNANPLSFESTDEAHSVAFKGLIQVDGVAYERSAPLNDGTNLRRARFGVGGTLFSDFEYALSVDYGGSRSDDKGRIFEAWTQYNHSDALTVRVGWFTPNVGLSDAGSSSATAVMERPAVVDMARNIAGGDTRAALIVNGTSGRLFYHLGLTGETLGKDDSKGQSALIARMAYLPFETEDSLIHVGVNAQVLLSVPDADLRFRERTELRVDDTRLIDAGAIASDGLGVYGAELGFQHKSLFVQGEVFRFEPERRTAATGVTSPRFGGHYIEGGWVITGEKRKYNTGSAAFDGVKPARPFNLHTGDWGAWEVTARYSHLNLDWHADSPVAADRVRGGRQSVASVGLGWTLNSHARVVAQAQQVRIKRQSQTGTDMGQRYSAFGVRTQLSF